MIKATDFPDGSAPRPADDGVFDVVVVGAGAAGLNAALLLGRARRKVVVLDAGKPRNAPAAHRDLLHCPYCHAYEVRDQPLAVLGTHPGAVHQALLLRAWSDDVVFLPHTLEPTAQDRDRLEARGLRIVEGEVKRLVIGNDQLRGIDLTDGRAVPRAAAFLFPRMVPRDELLTGLGCAKDDNGWVATDRTGRTNVAGVWAAGNVIDPRAQVITAAGMGSAAAFAINTDLLDEDVDHAVEQRRATVAGDGR
ncbi:hypothetical protein GCM10023191_016630 [Actinoallomurus oryzae]|uniref:Thioredoxin reductase n=1 Tax=Actinoallomurus oryzae TaxID=502180 RepID=A0ABP8PLK4_9ACTN